MFDGLKDTVRFQKNNDSTRYLGTKQKKHISLVQEPGSKSRGQTPPSGSTAADITNLIDSFFSKVYNTNSID